MPLTVVALAIQATHVVVPGVSTWTFSVQPPGREVAQVTWKGVFRDAVLGLWGGTLTVVVWPVSVSVTVYFPPAVNVQSKLVGAVKGPLSSTPSPSVSSCVADPSTANCTDSPSGWVDVDTG